MTGITNHDLGHDAEKRIAARLTAMGAEDVKVTATPHGCPDLSFSLNGVKFLTECKTVLGLHRGGKMGVAKVSSTEIQSMDSLSCDGSFKCMIVELRPKTHSKAPLYLFLRWELVREAYARRRPAVMSLTFWWLLKNGLRLEQIRSVSRAYRIRRAMGTRHLVMVNTRIENSLKSLLVSLSCDLGMNGTELVKACLRFALKSRAFREKMGLVLAEGDRLMLANLGDASVTIRTLVRRLSRNADVIMDHPSAAWLSVARLRCPEEQH